ncbi:MAG: Asp-tRNA(Asn)/Glu-tRNA(Gln) amidotransferase subunit GatB [Bacteroidota bacterium]
MSPVVSKSNEPSKAASRPQYTAVIGLEVHAQLLLQSKMFAPEPTTYGAPPNTQVSTISLAHPGTLPRINKQAIVQAIKMGLACQATITRENYFARKNYFYPDLPKGYQITQDKTPICQGGYLTITTPQGTDKAIRIQRMHLEEDAGKSIHGMVPDETLLDFNRAGVALLEIVTQPDIRTSAEAYQFLTELRKLVRYLDVCNGNMEEGALRCDVNISVMPREAITLGQKVEIKNMNAISQVRLAIEYEIARQIGVLAAGEPVLAETRGYDAATGQTTSQRTKESALDYRYFPEPDLLPIVVTEAWIEQVRQHMSLLPKECYQKLVHKYQLPAYDASVLTEDKEIAHFFEALCQRTPHYKAAANWMMGPVKAHLNQLNVSIQAFPLRPATLAALIDLVAQGQLSFSVAAQQLFPALLEDPTQAPLTLAQKLDLLQEQDTSTLQTLIEEVIAAYPDKVAAYSKGKKGILGMLMGEVMKRSQGKAAPKLASDLLSKRLAVHPSHEQPA